jgi:hypothetical protein
LKNVTKRHCHKAINPPEQMVLRNALIEPKLIEKAGLIAPPRTRNQRESLFGDLLKPFFDSIGQRPKSGRGHAVSALTRNLLQNYFGSQTGEHFPKSSLELENLDSRKSSWQIPLLPISAGRSPIGGVLQQIHSQSRHITGMVLRPRLPRADLMSAL